MKYKAIMLGDSVLYGATGGTRLSPHPQEVLNASQSVFDFSYNYATSGASFAGILSNSAVTRKANGLPGGITFTELLDQRPDARGVLFNLGGNDANAALIPSIMSLVDTCRTKGFSFCFIGLIDISVKQSLEYSQSTWGVVPSIQAASNVAMNAETVRQICLINGYPYIDIRNKVVVDLNNITGDLVHPDQAYSETIFKYVAWTLQASV